MSSFSFLIGRYTKIHAANKFSEKGFNNKSIMCLTFHQSKPVYSEPPACQSCCPGPATGSHLVSFCSANHEVHFLRRSSYLDPQHQQHNCSKQEVGKLLVFIILGSIQLNHQSMYCFESLTLELSTHVGPLTRTLDYQLKVLTNTRKD